jgi:hypothetical protein
MITIDRAKLKAAARFAADSKDLRLSLHGVLVEASPAGVRLAATDGHVLLVQRAAADADTDTWTGIVPSDVIKAALAWKGGRNLPIILVPGEPECRLTRATGEALLFVPVAGPFPDYRKVIPTAPDGKPSHYDPDFLVKFKRAAEDLGSDGGLFGLLPGGNGSGLVYLGEDATGVIMPMALRGGQWPWPIASGRQHDGPRRGRTKAAKRGGGHDSRGRVPLSGPCGRTVGLVKKGPKGPFLLHCR